MAQTIGQLVVKLTGDNSGLTSSLKSAESQIASMQKTVGGLNAALASAIPVFGAAAAAGAALGVVLFKMGDSFNQANNTIRIGTGATGAALEGLKKDFEGVVSDVPANFGTASQAIADLNTRLGLAGEPLQKITEQFLNLGRITGEEVPALIDVGTRAFGDWAIATEDQAKALDTVFKVSQNTGVEVSRLLGLVKQYGAPMRQFNFSFEEAAVMLGKWEKEGVNTELVLGSLRIAIGKFAREGVDLRTGLEDTIKKIQELGPSAEATSIAMETFGARAGPDMAAAILEGRFAIEDLMATVQQSDETINKAAEDTLTWRDNFKLAMNQIAVAIEPVATEFFQNMQESISDASEDLAKFLTEHKQEIENFGKQLGDIATNLKTIGENAVEAGQRINEFTGAFDLSSQVEQTGNLFEILAKISDLEPPDIGWEKFFRTLAYSYIGPASIVLEKLEGQFTSTAGASEELNNAVAEQDPRWNAWIDLMKQGDRAAADILAEQILLDAQTKQMGETFEKVAKHMGEGAMQYENSAEGLDKLWKAHVKANDGLDMLRTGVQYATQGYDDYYDVIQYATEGQALHTKAVVDAAVSQYKLKQATEDLAAANSIANKMVDDASNAISHWQGEIGEIQQAQEYLDQQLKDGSISVEDYNKKTQFLTEAEARREAGIKNDLIPTFVDSVIAQEDLVRQADELGRLHDENKISDEEYAKSMEDLRGQMEELNEGPMATLIDKLSTLVDILMEQYDLSVDTEDAMAQINAIREEIQKGSIFPVILQTTQQGVVMGQHGLNMNQAGLAIVGEAGPELVFLPRGSEVLSNPNSKKYMKNMYPFLGLFQHGTVNPVTGPASAPTPTPIGIPSSGGSAYDAGYAAGSAFGAGFSAGAVIGLENMAMQWSAEWNDLIDGMIGSSLDSIASGETQKSLQDALDNLFNWRAIAEELGWGEDIIAQIDEEIKAKQQELEAIGAIAGTSVMQGITDSISNEQGIQDFLDAMDSVWAQAASRVGSMFMDNITDVMSGKALQALQEQARKLELWMAALVEAGFGPGSQAYDDALEQWNEIMYQIQLITAIAGTEAGQTYLDEFGEEIDPELSNAIQDQLDESVRIASDAGAAAGNAYSDGFNNNLVGMPPGAAFSGAGGTGGVGAATAEPTVKTGPAMQQLGGGGGGTGGQTFWDKVMAADPTDKIKINDNVYYAGDLQATYGMNPSKGSWYAIEHTQPIGSHPTSALGTPAGPYQPNPNYPGLTGTYQVNVYIDGEEVASKIEKKHLDYVGAGLVGSR